MTKPNPEPKCRSCGEAFRKKWKRAVYCSVICQIRPRIRFGGPKECWEWQGAKNNHGYGQIRINGAHMYVHRAMFEACHQRPISKGRSLLHSCDNPSCCNPSHLREGEQSENLQDAAKRLRTTRALTPQQVAEVKALRNVVSQKELAERYNITTNTLRAWQNSELNA